MDIYIIILRLIHIFGGVAWVGASFLMLGSIKPAVDALGQEGGKFMQSLLGPGKFSQYMGLMGTATAVSGLLLYIRASNNFSTGWIASGQGIVLTIGALAGLAAWLDGIFGMRPIQERLKTLGAEIQSSDGPPSPDQLRELQSLQEKQSKHGAVSTIMMMLALIGMSAAEYVWA